MRTWTVNCCGGFGFRVSVALVGALLLLFATAALNAGRVNAQTNDWQPFGGGIDGEAPEDRSGTSVSLSADGTTMAVGEPRHDGNGTDSGQVRIYSQINFQGFDIWLQTAVIDGEEAGDRSGETVSLSDDGNSVAIGATGNSASGVDSGHVRIFRQNGSTWTQVGPDIDGQSSGDFFGAAVSLSADGNTVAIGAPFNSSNAQRSGLVRIFQFDLGAAGPSWPQLGADIYGNNAFDQSGTSVALTDDGSRLAIGSPITASTGGAGAGHVRIFDFVVTSWQQTFDAIDGEAAVDDFGSAVALSPSGNVLAVGAPRNNDGGNNAGHVRAYLLLTSNTVQLGPDIDGESAGDFSGSSLAVSEGGTRIAIGATGNSGQQGHVRVYEFRGLEYFQLGSDLDGEAAGDMSGASVALSEAGSRVAIGAPFNDGNGNNSGHVRAYDFDDAATPEFCNGLTVTVDIGLGQSPTAGDDVILGTAGDDTINGLGGDDTICGEGGNDVLTGGTGNDTVFGGAGNDLLTGAAGNDTLSGEAGVDRINGGVGNDIINGGAGNDDLRGQGGNDTMNGEDGVDQFFGGSGQDTINTGSGGNAGTGIIVQGQSGADTIFGSPQDDELDGGLGQDEIHGGAGNDVLNGGRSGDDLFGDAGNDQLFGGPDRDALDGGAGTDECNGGGGTNDSATATCETTTLVP